MTTFFEDFFNNCDKRPTYVAAKAQIELAKQIEVLMQQQSISEKELAKRIRRSKTYVVNLLRGDIDLTIIMLAKLSIIFKTQLSISLGD